MLAPDYRVILQAADQAVTGGARNRARALVALHARRSRAAIAAWRAAYPERALVVVLTGTDLYGDLPDGDVDARASLADADRLLVLQDDAREYVPPSRRDDVDVVRQSARALQPFRSKSGERLHCVLVAHLRPVKDPATAFDAWCRLPRSIPATLTIIGDALDPQLGAAARALAASDPRVHWLGPRAHAWTRQAIKRAHLLLCPSRMEGGANVVVEAITAGTPVLASRISGNLGMLGAGYDGYFAAGDAAALAALVVRAAEDRAWLASLERQCAARAPLFAPAAERRALFACVAHALTAAEARTGKLAPQRATSPA